VSAVPLSGLRKAYPSFELLSDDTQQVLFDDIACVFQARGFTPLNSSKIPIICGLLATAALTIATAYVTSETAVMSYISLAYLLSGVASASIWALVTAATPPDYIASSGSI
jgi:hypothetical protein